MKKYSLVSGIALLLVSSMAFAQFGGSILGGKKSDGAKVSPEEVVKLYVHGAKSVMVADEHMLGALGMKELADAAAVQAKNLTEGASKDSLEAANKVQTENSRALEEKFATKKVVLDEASKKKFAKGVGELSKGVINYVEMSKKVSGFKPDISSMSGAGNSAVFIVKSLPSSITNLGSTLKMAIEFSKENNIPVPKEANDATAML